jgi:AcrR family transcriptional regulator
MGLMRALMMERAQALEEAVTAGPPPLGEGAPDRDRLLAFLDAIVEVVGRNKSLLAELAYSAATQPPAKEHAAEERDKHPVYRFWHDHVSALIATQRPDADADLFAHLMLGALHSEPILNQLTTDGPERLTAAMRALACAVLDAPAGSAGTSAHCQVNPHLPDDAGPQHAYRGPTP